MILYVLLKIVLRLSTIDIVLLLACAWLCVCMRRSYIAFLVICFSFFRVHLSLEEQQERNFHATNWIAQTSLTYPPKIQHAGYCPGDTLYVSSFIKNRQAAVGAVGAIVL